MEMERKKPLFFSLGDCEVIMNVGLSHKKRNNFFNSSNAILTGILSSILED
jgi:hypothetical protein